MSFTLDLKRDIFSNAHPGGLAFGLSNYIEQSGKSSHLIISESAGQAQRLFDELNFLCPNKNILLFPDLEILPFDYFSASEDIHSTRLATLYRLSDNMENIIIAAATTLLKRLPPKHFIRANSLVLKKGDRISQTEKRKALEASGYRFVNQVLSRGEFSVRGSILDIFPMGGESACRIDFFDDEVDSIRSFDIETQRSEQPIDAINILPTQEFIFDKNSLDYFAEQWRNNFGDDSLKNELCQNILARKNIAGIEFYLPFFHEKLATLFDYLPPECVIHHIHQIDETQKRYFEDIKARHEQLNYNTQRPLAPVASIYLTPQGFARAQRPFKKIKWLNRHKQKSTVLPFTPLEDIHVHYQYKEPYHKLLKCIDEHPEQKYLFSTDSIGRREVLLEQLQKRGIRPSVYPDWQTAARSTSPYAMIVSPLIEGFSLTGVFTLITEHDLFANHIKGYRQKRQTQKYDPGVAVRDLSELSPNAAVVHIEYGVGRYQGLTKLALGHEENEYLTLSFKNDEKLYVPIHDLHLVSRYSGTELEHAPLSRLGSDKWAKEKEKAAKNLNDVAAELLAVYAERNLKQGFSNHFDEKAYLGFCQGFPFEETPDQQSAIDDVLEDMISEKPMDRLVCGDVGFGKTEVAMRAAFVAIDNRQQVAILAPTTLLAEQHYHNFSDRFSELGASVEVLSRFKRTKAQSDVIRKLKEGKIDIIIGTHKLLSDEVRFDNLGLLIIDEEHRFGVVHKEKMKAMRANIDILTMTATPIPRTLNMAFSAIRDLSVISTAPAKRLMVKTFVKPHNNTLIKEAVMREILRGGQVYYLHNDVQSIYAKAEVLQAMFPEQKIAVAHGQMRERELEKVMFEFQQNRYSILLCTTIIETGIDIANANTIIIERADKFGLAQLHQLRGRVGRSHHQAYAYLMTPPEASSSKEAKKRLEAICETASIGGGFMLANHDLEIRGAGELLGKEQSGNMQGIGFNLYMDLLQKTVRALQKGETFDIHSFDKSGDLGSKIELRIPSLFPEEYIFDAHTRLSLYKRISNAESHHALNDIQIEIIDRFGKLPPYGGHVFKLAHLKLDAAKLGIQKIEMHSAGGKIRFNTPLSFDPGALIALVQLHPGDFKLNKDQELMITKALKSAEARIDFIENFIQKLTDQSGG